MLATFPSAALGGEVPGDFSFPVPLTNHGSGFFDAGPRMGFNREGVGFMVWTHFSSDTGMRAYFSRMDPRSGWSAPGIVPTPPVETFGANSIGVDPAGNALALIVTYDNVSDRQDLWFNRYGANFGWEEPRLIEHDDAGNVSQARIAVDGSGNAIAGWRQGDGVRNNIWGARYTVAGGWGSPVLLETDDSGGTFSPDVAVGADGNGLVTWYQFDGALNNTWENRFSPTTGWAGPLLLETTSIGAAQSPSAAADDQGGLYVAWYQANGSGSEIWWNSYKAGTGWAGAAPLVVLPSAIFGAPELASDAGGNLTVAVSLLDGFQIWSGLANRPAGGSWSALARALTYDDGNGYQSTFVIDPAGFAIVFGLWNDGGNGSGWANVYVPSMGWQTARLFEFEPGYVSTGAGAVDGVGGVWVAWYQDDGISEQVYVTGATAPDVSAPFLDITDIYPSNVTSGENVWISGTTEPGAMVFVGDVAAFVNPNGTFGINAGLVPGLNRIPVDAYDAAGNHAHTFVDVRFDDPRVALEQQLSQAWADLNATSTQLNQTKGQLDSTRADLTTAYAQLNATRADLQSTNGRLATAEQNATAASQSTAKASADAAAAQSSVGTAVALAGLGMAMGAAGLAAAALAMRKKNPGEPPKQS